MMLVGVLIVWSGPVCFAQKVAFNSKWVWEYQNDWLEADAYGHKGEFAAYHDSRSDTWLFTTDSYGSSSEMIDFMVGMPDGRYLICYTDHTGEKKRLTEQVSDMVEARKMDAQLLEEFKLNYREENKQKRFAENDKGLPQFTGEAYTVQFLKTSEKVTRYVADSKIDFLPVVFFNHMNGDAKLPVYFPTDVPLQQILLEEYAFFPDGKEIIIRLKEVSPVKRKVNLKLYR